MSNRDAYHRRIERVVGYICSHLEEELSVDNLSAIAGFSKFHFHRGRDQESRTTVRH